MKLLKTLILLAAVSVFAGASQVGESLSRLYRRLQSIEQKYTVMLDLVALDDRSLEPFYVRSLNELVYGDLTHYRANKSTFDQWEALTRTIVMELGDIKGQSASIPIWQLARTAESSMLKAESLIALGRMNAQEYAPKISTMLQVLNLNQRPDKEAAEIEAYGAVTALGRMKADDGLEPVFYASIGWYQDRVTELADKFLLTSFKDPVPALIAIIEDAQEYPVKRKALEVVFRTEAPVEEKVKAPLIALQLGLHSNETDKALKIEQANLRMDAITAYITLDTSHPSMPVLLNDSIDEGVLDEKLIAIQALGTDGSISAVEKLSLRLQHYNGRQNSGVTLSHDEQVIVRQLVFAIGEAGIEEGLNALQEVAYSAYTPALKRQAREVIKKIQGN